MFFILSAIVEMERVESFTSQLLAGYEEECEDSQSPPDSAETAETAQYGEDRSVPPGWRLRLEGCRGLLSPGGLSYRSSRQAYQDLIWQGAASNQEIEAMRSCLKYEDWRSDSSLLAGWSSRLAGRRKLLRDGEGKVYRSVRAALETVLTRGHQGDQGDTLRAALEREGWSRVSTLEHSGFINSRRPMCSTSSHQQVK